MIGFGWVITHFGDVFLESIQVFLWFLVRFVEKGPKRENFGQLSKVPRSGEETPRGNEELRRGRAEREEWPGLWFATAKPLFTTLKCCVFVSFCFSVFSKTCILN